MKVASRDVVSAKTRPLDVTKETLVHEKKKKVLRIHVGTEIWTEINKGLKFTSFLN